MVKAVEYDIAIIGQGPAGATLARLLDSSLRVIAIDKKDASLPHTPLSDGTRLPPGMQGFQKPCGGLLAPDAQKALSKFHLTLPKEVLVDPQIFAVKTMDTGQQLLRYYQRFYMNLDRHKFDLWLQSLIPEHVEQAAGARCTGICRIHGGFAVAYKQAEVQHSIRARYVVGADGAHSIVRRELFPQKEMRQYSAIQQWFIQSNAAPFYSCIFDKQITDSYCWSIVKDGYFILGGAFPKQNAKASFALLKQKLTAQGFSFGEPVKTESCLVAMPRGLRDFCIAKDGAFLLGEAAGFISPSSLEGISYALNSACFLAEALHSGKNRPERMYQRLSAGMEGKLLLKYLKAPFMYQPLLRKLVMKSGLRSIRILGEQR